MATRQQLFVYHTMKTTCKTNGIPQSTLEHKSLLGSFDTADPTTGNQIYTGPGPVTADPTTTTTKVWAVWMPQESMRHNEREQVPFRMNVPSDKAQCPAIDDNGTAVVISHDDWLIDSASIKYRILNPTLSHDNGYWVFTLQRQR